MATTVRSWLGMAERLARPEGPAWTSYLSALRASITFLGDPYPDLTVEAISSRPFGPDQPIRLTRMRLTSLRRVSLTIFPAAVRLQ